MASAPDSARLAVLIDGDNTTPTIIEALLAEIAKYGSATVKRAYGDWTTQQLAGWKEQLLSHAIQPIQQFAYTRGKNATDSALHAAARIGHDRVRPRAPHHAGGIRRGL